MNSENIQDTYVSDFLELDDPFLQHEYLIQLASLMPPLTKEEHAHMQKVQGCQSRVWLSYEMKQDGTVEYNADSDTLIIRGVLRIIMDTYSGQPARAIVKTPFDVLQKTNVKNLLSSNRQGGIDAIISCVQRMADECLAEKKRHRGD